VSEPEKRIRNGKVRWYVRYFDPSGSRRSKTFDRKVDAQRFQRQVETSIRDTNSYIDPTRSKITLGVFADKWLKTQAHLKPSTYARYAGIVTKHIKPRWQSVPLNKIGHADVAEWISEIRLSAASVRYTHRVMFLILERRRSHNLGADQFRRLHGYSAGRPIRIHKRYGRVTLRRLSYCVEQLFAIRQVGPLDTR
jgi:Phage integrase, N-terminal SAM-like domain